MTEQLIYPSVQISAFRNGKSQLTIEQGVLDSVIQLLQSLKIDINDPNFKETSRRLTNYFLEHFISQEEVELVLADCQRAVFPSPYAGMVVVREVKVEGMCPHHLLPVHYKIDVAYIPTEFAIGLSKVHRLAEIYGCQPVMQETFTTVLADELKRILQTEDVAVIVRGEHSCMQIRGVKSHDAFVYTSELRGGFLNESSMKEELYFLLKMK